MPISNFPFLKASDADPMPRPWLFVRINNPDTGAYFFLNEHIDFGEIIIIFLLFFIVAFGSLKLVWNYLQRGTSFNKKL